MTEDFFERGIADIIDKKSFQDRLKSGKLRIKYGVDPTRPDIHLGHAVAMWKLRALQDAGHTVIFLIGDYTTKIGDPSGRNTTRPVLTDEEIKANAKTYLDQAGKILDIKKTEVRFNSEWFTKMSFADVLQLLGKFTLAGMIERDDFEKRLKDGVDIGLHEILYPVMQAYDSIALKADVEFGGTDQRFNLLAGRELQKKMGQAPQDIVMVELLVGLEGKIKMSKSTGNYISITEPANEMYGKVMSIADDLILKYFELCTQVTNQKIAGIKKELEGDKNPRDIKMELALEITKLYHGETAAKKAEEEFVNRFSKKELPSDIAEIKIGAKNIDILTLITLAEAAASKSEARRLIEQGGVRVDGAKITNYEDSVGIPEEGIILEVGKRKVFRILQ